LKTIAAVSACLWLFCSSASSAPVSAELEVHGAGDAYAGGGIAIAWGVLRGATESATLVVLRVAADPAKYKTVEVVGRNPFSRSERKLLRETPVSGRVDVRIPRASFADFPRTELRFAPDPPTSTAPAIVIYYLGVPDTTPEFANEAALDAHLTDRIARARAAKSP
jgi:hypothetical protein